MVGLMGAQFAASMPPAQANPLTMAPVTILTAHSAIAHSLDDYQPPDVGGPGQTQGTGTR